MMKLGSNAWLRVIAAAVVLSVAACSRAKNKEEQIAALESAYQAGLLTKAEYDTKKTALLGPASPPPAAAASNSPAPVTPPAPASSPVAAPPAPTPAVAAPSARTNEATPPASAPATSPPAAAPSPRVEVATIPKIPAEAHGREEQEEEPAPASGCEDAEYQSGKVRGAKQRFYPASIEAVRKAAHEALGSLDFNINKDARDEMEATKRRHIGVIVGAGGEHLLLHFEQSRQGGQAGTLVTGETKKTLTGRLAQKSWTDAILAQIACHLRAGR